jgi:hypothetical protein
MHPPGLVIRCEATHNISGECSYAGLNARRDGDRLA